MGNDVELPCPKLFQAFSVKFTLFFFMSAFIQSFHIQHMQKVFVLKKNCDFESTLKSRLRSRNRPIIGGYRLVGEIDLLSLINIGSTLSFFRVQNALKVTMLHQ